MNPLRYFKEVRVELAKVVWPSRIEVVKLTTTVIILSAVVGAYLGGIDLLFTALLSKLVSL